MKPLDLVVSKFKELQAAHGKDSIGVYSGSSLTTEKTYLMGKFARAGLGTRYVDYNGRLCMVSAAAGNNKAFGIDRAANPWDDIPLAEVLLIAGSNCAETFPVLNKFLWQQRDNGGSWIIVDPRETATARQGDLHLQLKPGTDVALANGLLHVLIEEDLLDQNFIAARTNGWEETKALAARYSPQVAAEITGVPAERLCKPRGCTAAPRPRWFSTPVESNTTRTASTMCCRISIWYWRPEVSARPDVATARSLGKVMVRADVSMDRRLISFPVSVQSRILNIASTSAKFGIYPKQSCRKPAYPSSRCFRRCAKARFAALLSICNNVMVSLPDTNEVRRSLEGLDFYVCIDFFMSEGSRYADVVLPGSTWSEDEGVTANSEGRVLKINKAADPPGEARADWWIIQEIARRLGREKYFQFD